MKTAVEQAQDKIKELELLVEKLAVERDYYYELWKKANAYIVTH